MYLRTSLLFVVFLVSDLSAQLIDFEEVPGVGTPSEGLIIDTQYQAEFGITFSLEGGGAPVIAEIGAPLTAFSSAEGGQDAPAPGQDIGRFFLTDDGLISAANPPAVIVSYGSPTAAASGAFVDLDGEESIQIEARDASNMVLEILVFRDGDPGTGDGIITTWVFSRAQADISSIRILGMRPACCFGMAFDNFSPRSAGEEKLYFAQFGNGTLEDISLRSDLVLPNPSATQTASGAVTFSKADGSPFATEVEGEGTTSSVEFTVFPLESTTVSTTGQGTFSTGTAVVSSNTPLGGVIRFDINAPPGIGSGIAGVPASQVVGGFVTPARRFSGGINTGVAIRNVGPEEVNVNLSLRGEDGVEVPFGSAARSIPGNGQLVDFINSLFPDADTANFVGSVVVTSDGMIAGTALEQGVKPGEFTTLPVTPLE